MVFLPKSSNVVIDEPEDSLLNTGPPRKSDSFKRVWVPGRLDTCLFLCIWLRNTPQESKEHSWLKIAALNYSFHF